MTRTEAGREARETINDVANRYNVHPRTVRRWIAEGRITAYRLGPRLIRLNAAEVDAALRPAANRPA